MSLCVACGLALPEEHGELCLNHTYAIADDWAQTNKVMCDFFHRQVIPPPTDVQIVTPDVDPADLGYVPVLDVTY